MKKIIALLLASLLCFSICACGGDEKLTEEELLKTAVSTDIQTLQTAAYENKLKAKEDYCNKSIIISGTVLSVEEDYVVLHDSSKVFLDAYLSVDDLTSISSGDRITVVGIISDIQDKEVSFGGFIEPSFTSPHYIMNLGYLVQ